MKIGIIGAGNMASAIMGGLLSSGKSPADLYITDTNKTRTDVFAEKGVNVLSNIETAKSVDVIIYAVKPNVYNEVLCETKDFLEGKIVVSIAAGMTVKYIKSIVGQNKKVVCTMPNTPALVGEGMTALAFSDNISEQEKSAVLDIFCSFGKAIEIDEKMMDAVVSVSGSSPAFVFMMIDAMADGAVLEGLPRAKAIEMAAQAVLGSAQMVLKMGKHPGELKDMVCSPGGTTIEGVKALEANGFKAAVIEAMHVTAEKNRKLKKQ